MEQTTQPQEVVLNKEDVLYEVDVHMSASVLYDYMLRHTYMSLTGPLATVLYSDF